MDWKKKLRLFSKTTNLPDSVFAVEFAMDGWTEQPPNGKMRMWRHTDGGVLSLSEMPADHWFSEPEAKLREDIRQLAAKCGGGLIELTRAPCGKHTTVRYIYKRLQGLGYVFTGMFIYPGVSVPLVWTVVNGERGTTGVREAIVMAELTKATKPQSVEDLQKLWGEDPFDMVSLGVDSRIRRFTSDAEEYDERFPDHPLSRVRQCMRDLGSWVQSGSVNPVTQSETQ